MSPRMVFIKSVRKLYSSFNEKHTPVSLSLFFRYKPYYCVRPTEKENLSCLCINCLNLHLLLQSIDIYWKSKFLPSHNSLTEYINRLQNGENFTEANDEKPCKFYSYVRVTESYTGKEGKPVEYTRTAKVDDTKPVKHLVNLIKDGSKKFIKHRKEGKPVEYTRTAKVDDTKPVKHLVNLIKDGSKKFIKHRTYVTTAPMFFP